MIQFNKKGKRWVLTLSVNRAHPTDMRTYHYGTLYIYKDEKGGNYRYSKEIGVGELVAIESADFDSIRINSNSSYEEGACLFLEKDGAVTSPAMSIRNLDYVLADIPSTLTEKQRSFVKYFLQLCKDNTEPRLSQYVAK